MNMAKLSDEDREALTAYLDGELDEASARSVETRLNLDPNTRHEAEALKQAWNMLDYLPKAEPSASFTHRTLERLATETGVQRRILRPWLAGALWATGALLAAAAGFGIAAIIWRPSTDALGVEGNTSQKPPVVDKKHGSGKANGVEPPEEEWLKRQPAAFRNKLAKLAGEQRAQEIKKRRDKESTERIHWQIARRFWDDVTKNKRPQPERLTEFPEEVQNYVKRYLLPRLAPGELAVLQESEGHWPHYPMALVDLADRHPLALPDPRGPKKIGDLPEEILHRLFRAKLEKAKPQMRQLNDMAARMGLGRAVAQRAKNKLPDGVILPHELWPYREKCLSPQVQDFIKKKLQPLLTPDEKLALVHAETEGVWPDYPRKLKELAEKHDLRVPWQTLPGPPMLWDRYRVRPYFLAEEKTARTTP
jgi:hypothetical protein